MQIKPCRTLQTFRIPHARGLKKNGACEFDFVMCTVGVENRRIRSTSPKRGWLFMLSFRFENFSEIFSNSVFLFYMSVMLLQQLTCLAGFTHVLAGTVFAFTVLSVKSSNFWAHPDPPVQEKGICVPLYRAGKLISHLASSTLLRDFVVQIKPCRTLQTFRIPHARGLKKNGACEFDFVMCTVGVENKRIMLFDTNAASENEPSSDQQKSKFRVGFYSVLKRSACRRGVTIYICIHIICSHFFIYIYIHTLTPEQPGIHRLQRPDKISIRQ